MSQRLGQVFKFKNEEIIKKEEVNSKLDYIYKMSKKRGLSVEDKRRVILSIYHDNKEPYNLKDIENLASRMVSKFCLFFRSINQIIIV